MSRRLALTVTPELAGIKVDTLLKRHLQLSGTVVRRVKWLEDGILVDGVRVNTRFCPAAGQVLSVRLSDPVRNSGIVPAPGPLDIVHEDYYEKTGQEADFHPVHRLDRGTSGLLVAAKHPHAQEVLKNQLHTEDFRRVYLAVCEGLPDPPAGVIDAPLGPKPGSLMEQMVRPDGKPARTKYGVLRRWGDRALVSLELETGRTHQIRVHMAHTGHPLTGDFLYGTEDRALIPRPALHSGYLSFRHPLTGENMQFSVPLPEDMSRLKM